MRLSVLRDFSRTPGPRLRIEGPFSGEEFREKWLGPAIRSGIAQGEKVEVDLDGVAGYGTSFLEESFGGLIRTDKISLEQLSSVLSLLTNDPELREEIEEYLDEAERKEKQR